jgi:hypothetical protein
MLVAGTITKIFPEVLEIPRTERVYKMLEFVLLDAISNSQMKFDIYDSKIDTFLENVQLQSEVIISFHIKSKINPKTGRYYNNLIVDNVFLLKDNNGLLVKDLFKNNSDIQKLF